MEVAQRIGPATVVRPLSDEPGRETYLGVLDGTRMRVVLRSFPRPPSPAEAAALERRLQGRAGRQHPRLAPVVELVEQMRGWWLIEKELEGVALSELLLDRQERREPMPFALALHLSV